MESREQSMDRGNAVTLFKLIRRQGFTFSVEVWTRRLQRVMVSLEKPA